MGGQTPFREPVALAYRDSGPVDGTPVVLLHGAGADSTTWDVLGDWPKHWRVIRVDLPGHGSSPCATSYDLPDIVNDVRTLLERLNLSEVNLVGHSMGAMVAYIFAQRVSRRVSRLVLAEPPPPLPASPARDEGPRPAGALDYDWSFQESFTRSRNHPDPSWWKELSTIASPTLILAGQRGGYAAEAHRAMARRIPDCKVRFLAGSHHLHYDCPAEFRAALSAFLDA